MALIAEGAPLFDKAQFLGITVILVAGGAVFAVRRFVGVSHGGESVVAFVTGWFFPCGRRRKTCGTEYGQHRQGCQQFAITRHVTHKTTAALDK